MFPDIPDPLTRLARHHSLTSIATCALTEPDPCSSCNFLQGFFWLATRHDVMGIWQSAGGSWQGEPG